MLTDYLDTTILDIDILQDKNNIRKNSNGIAYKGEQVGINIRGINKLQVNKGEIFMFNIINDIFILR